ncbi:gamma-aminobutyric acid type B receptor subunit 2-like isoform X2 [Dysidea avara]|uniref:gamma-aminobutyric acid type B receptor subunit 2-like isoform X2 n=1 Tax=Dysidea avara TaxID=196820 RepID=UPI003324EA38
MNPVSVLVIIITANTNALLLCDGDCTNNPDINVCQKEPKDSDITDIVLLGLFPCNTPSFRAGGLTAAAQMAIRQISYNGNNSNLLKGYRLQLLVNESMCDPERAAKSFIYHIHQNNNPIITAILGPGCSSAVLSIAELASFSNLIQVSYTASSPDLNNTNRFPTFFRAISSDISTVAANVATIRQFGWRQVAIITQNVELFREVRDQLKSELVRNRINVISNDFSYINNGRAEDIIVRIRSSGTRIVIMNVYEEAARQLLCLARRQNMIYPRFVWMTYGWYSEGWWEEIGNDINNRFVVDTDNCTLDEMQQVIYRSLSFHHFPLPTEEENDSPTDVNYTPNEFWMEYRSILDQLGYPGDEPITQARYVYDAVWMIALTLNQSIPDIEDHLGLTLQSFTYDHSDITDIFIKRMSNLTFRGVSGKVIIKNRERQPNLRIEQYQMSETGRVDSIPVAMLSDDGTFHFSNNMSLSDIWPDTIESSTTNGNSELLVAGFISSALTVVILLFVLLLVYIGIKFYKKRNQISSTKYSMRKETPLDSISHTSLAISDTSLETLENDWRRETPIEMMDTTAKANEELKLDYVIHTAV